MDNSEKSFLKEFAPCFEKTSVKEYVWIFSLLAVIGLGVYAFLEQVLKGHIVTGMRDNVVWGIYIVNFIFFMGLSYAGALISGTLHLFRVEWRKPIIRIAELIALISLMIGPFYILLCIGRLDRAYYLMLYGRIQSPISWDEMAISTYIFGWIIFLYISLLGDLAKMRDFEELRIPKWRKKLYKFLAIGYEGTEYQRKRLEKTMDIMAVMVISIVIIVYSVLAWIFSVTLQPGWHSTIYGPYFVIAAVYSGSAVLIVAMWVFRKFYHLEHYITKKHFIAVGMIMLVFAALFGYFTFNDLLTKWYGSQKHDEVLIRILFKEFYWPFIFANFIGVFLPMIILGIKKLRSIPNITLTAAFVIIAIWINRYLIIIPTLQSPYLPIQDPHTEWSIYSSTWVEWSLTAAGIAVFCLLFTLASKFIPIITVGDYSKEDTKEKTLV